jgi:CRP-like cAMP-binding protein
MDDDLDFSTPPAKKAEAARVATQPTAESALYQPALALQFFRDTALLEKLRAGKPVFKEGDRYGGLFSKGARMYLLLDGEIGLTVKGKDFGAVKPGEIFGELAVIAGLPRTATATVRSDCQVLSLDEKLFHAALQKTPEFALMLMSIMGQRLRDSVARLAGASVAIPSADRSGVLDAKMLEELAADLGGQPPLAFKAGKVIVSAGSAGVTMFVVMKGRVAISIGDKVVENVGPGGMFGEMALVDRTARAANATAETDCALFAIARNDFVSLVKAKPAFGVRLLRCTAERMQQLAAQVAKLP